MTNKEAIERIETHMHIHAGAERHAVYITEALEKAIEALLAQEEFELAVCECCGKKIDHINTSVFNYDGTDSEHSIPIQYEPVSGCVTFTTNKNWTDYELTDEERKDGIRCPYCGKYPFDMKSEIEIYEPVEVMMWKAKKLQESNRMNDSISKQVVVDRVLATKKKDCGSTVSLAWNSAIEVAAAKVDSMIPVRCVPLEPLCKLLSDIHGAPCNHTDICSEICGDTCSPMMSDEECWRAFLTKWMEEQNGG